MVGKAIRSAMAKVLNPQNTYISCYKMSQISAEFVLKK